MLEIQDVAGGGDFSLQCILIEFAVPNLGLIYICITEISITSVLTWVFGKKKSLKFGCECCEFIIYTQIWCGE